VTIVPGTLLSGKTLMRAAAQHGDVGLLAGRERADLVVEIAADRLAVIVICLAMLLAGCGGSVRGDASAGPNPGGGFYSPSNIDNGRVNP